MKKKKYKNPKLVMIRTDIRKLMTGVTVICSTESCGSMTGCSHYVGDCPSWSPGECPVLTE